MRRLFALAGVVLALATPASARDVVQGELGAALDVAVQRASRGGFWGTVLVARGGEVVLAKGYGNADYGQAPNGPQTLFEIASLSKQFTAAAILKLESAGKLSLEDPLSKVLPGVPKSKAKILVRQLLRHTAGISPDLVVPYGWEGDRSTYLALVLAAPLASEPGVEFAYSNVGYALLAAIVEEVSGQGFEDYVSAELFGPAKLRETGFVGDARLIESPRTSLRLAASPAPLYPAAQWPRGWGYRGMGGVVTSASDLLAWDRALRGTAVLDEAAKNRLHTPGPSGYACGWLVETTARGSTKVHHGGGVQGYVSQLSRYLEEDATIVILSNGESELGEIEVALERLLFPPPTIEATIDLTQQPIGDDRVLLLEGDLTLTVSRRAERLSLELLHQARALAQVHFPRTYAKTLIRGLRASLEEEREIPPESEVGLYLQNYEAADGRVTWSGGLVIVVQPRYVGVNDDGTQLVDERPLLILVDEERGRWPLMLHLGSAAVDSLLTELESHLPHGRERDR